MAEKSVIPGDVVSPGIFPRPRRGLQIDPQIIGLVIALIVLVILIGSQQGDKFFLPRNLLNIGLSISLIGLTAVAQTLVMLSGGLDVSIGSTVGLTAVFAAIAMRDFSQLPLLGTSDASPAVIALFAVLVGLVCGTILGFVNGALITWGRLNPVIATLGTLSVYKGLAYVVTNGSAVGVINREFNSIGSQQILGIPLPLIILLFVSLIIYILLRFTDIGRNIYAMGGNPQAARLSGINLNRYKLFIYSLSGTIAGVTAIVLTARTNSGQPESGSESLTFASITAAVLGGTALSGGKGTVFATLLAVILIGTLNNGMILLGVPTFWQEVARGMLLVIATLIQVWRTRERAH
jgi:ribose/xylose/arabinose/galactoside ABC-type transport system permease subunit